METHLVTLASGGNLKAFEELVSRYQRAVFSIALYKSRNYFDAEDLTQDVFLAAFRALGTLKTPESFGAWLFGIAYNRCHKWYRRERTKVLKFQEVRDRVAREERLRVRATQGGGAAPAVAPGSAAAGESHVSEALLRLPQEVRETLRLKYLEGLSYQEIEERLGINAHRIDYLIRKGKQMLRERLGRRGDLGMP
ncbi:MAG: sigma-70 family RNA polymerase sigma factor [Planctomycetes bacterium]|nr:sigma-70 family RNA polymerase sigma factor [Planctomycetota bacterium]